MGGGESKKFSHMLRGVQKVLAACEWGVKKVWRQKFSIAQPPTKVFMNTPLMKSEHIPANQCIPLQASVHSILYHCITRTKFDQFDWGFQFWICLSVCLSVCQPAWMPACLCVCVCVWFFFSKFFDTDLKIQLLLCFICHWTTVLTIDFHSLWRVKYRSHCSVTSLYWRSLPKV